MLFVPAAPLVVHLAKAHLEGTLDERITFYSKPKLLIVDELCYPVLDVEMRRIPETRRNRSAIGVRAALYHGGRACYPRRATRTGRTRFGRATCGGDGWTFGWDLVELDGVGHDLQPHIDAMVGVFYPD